MCENPVIPEHSKETRIEGALYMDRSDYTVSGVYIGRRAQQCRIVLQNGPDKTPKASTKEQSVMENSLGIPHDTKSLRSCSGN